MVGGKIRVRKLDLLLDSPPTTCSDDLLKLFPFTEKVRETRNIAKSMVEEEEIEFAWSTEEVEFIVAEDEIAIIGRYVLVVLDYVDI